MSYRRCRGSGRTVLAGVTALVLVATATVAVGTSAVAAGSSGTISAVAAMAAKAAEPLPPVDNVLPGVLRGSEQELRVVAETACEVGRLDQRACKMTKSQLDRLPSDLNSVVKEAEKLARKAGQAEGLAGGVQSRSTAGVAQVLGKILTGSTKPAVRKLAKKADQFADWADSAADVAGLPLTEATAVDYAKSVIRLVATAVPPIGDLFSLADSVATGDVEQGVVAVLGVAATAIGLANPVAGAVIAAGTVIYSLGKLLWNFFRAKPRDWIEDPPGTAEELYRSGANLTWTAHKIGGKSANVVFSNNSLIATQTLLMDSRWTEHNRDRKPVTYTVSESQGQFYYSITGSKLKFREVGLVVWQDGKSHVATCRIDDVYFPPVPGEFVRVRCGGLKGAVTIAHGKPAVLAVGYILRDYDQLAKVCPARPCVSPSSDNQSYLTVLSEHEKPVQITLPLTVGIT